MNVSEYILFCYHLLLSFCLTRLDDVVSESTRILESSAINTHLVAERLDALNSLYRETERDKRKKRKRVGESMQTESDLHPDVAAFEQYVSGMSLTWWKYVLFLCH